MLIKCRAAHPLTEQDVTPEAVYQDRRLILKGLGLSAATGNSALANMRALLKK